ncbi:AIPR family protein [Bernardetia sp. OM2101]|uniref:AIPR family protein n=1 Tax=Bernardetia sp. OM2101 TaxID=3344876 RepID=UPI0035CFB742
MLTNNFYKLLNKELVQILDNNKEDEELHKHKKDEQNKGYAFLIWFLNFYGQKTLYKQYITDGKDDSSCDIIFENTDSQGQRIFYVVQSKWINITINEEGNLVKKGSPIQEFPKIGKEEFNAVIKEFDTVLDGSKKEGKNEKFNEKYRKLIEHLEANGKAKFIFFTAADTNPEIEDTIKSFEKQHAPNVTFQLIDINRIKQDYIEFKYKEIVANNPLEYNYDPEDEEIILEVERFNSGEHVSQESSKRDMLQFEGRMQAYIFLLKPKTVHALFQKFKFSLFFKNIRNPLRVSEYNEQIVETLQKRPDTFWYFNNGITAITKRIPDVGNHSKTFTVKGLQVINGAQTVYSIYKAYESATIEQREIMDTDARVSFRLIRSSDEQFNMEITRFTNQQNQMEDRDFVANREEQRRLQLESFKTNFWYEKRRGEFRDIETLDKLEIDIVTNVQFARAYLAFHLQKPFEATFEFSKEIFAFGETGLYEKVFVGVNFEDMITAYIILAFYDNYRSEFIEENNRDTRGLILNGDTPLYVLAISKTIIEKYLLKKNQKQYE